jgi:uncharacterized protein YjeT (DUF2065 family)
MEEEKKEQPEQGQSVKKAKKPIDLSKGGLLWTIWHLVEAALLITGGILAIVYSNNEKIQSYIYPVVGGFMIFGGVLKIVSNFLPVLATNAYEAEAKIRAKKAMAYDMVVGGSFELALGITLCMVDTSAVEVITNFITNFIAIILMVAGASLLLFAIGFIISKLYKLYMPILEIIFGLCLIGLGIIVIYFLHNNSSALNQIVLIVTGLILVLGGLGMLVDTFATVRAANALKKASKEGTASPVKEETATASVSVTEVDFSTEEGKKAAPENKPDDEKPSDDKK